MYKIYNRPMIVSILFSIVSIEKCWYDNLKLEYSLNTKNYSNVYTHNMIIITVICLIIVLSVTAAKAYVIDIVDH